MFRPHLVPTLHLFGNCQLNDGTGGCASCRDGCERERERRLITMVITRAI